MPGAESRVVQVVGLDPRLDEAAHQRLERRRVVVDAGQQHGLAHHRHAGVDDPGAGGAGGGGQLARMVGVQRDVGGLASGCASPRPAPAVTVAGSATGTRVWKRTTFTCSISARRAISVGQPARREHQRIAAGQDHLPDRRVGGDVGEGGVQLGGRQRRGLAGPDHLAAEAEAAVDRAGVGHLQQHPVRVAVHDAADRRCGRRRRSGRPTRRARRSARPRWAGTGGRSDRRRRRGRSAPASAPASPPRRSARRPAPAPATCGRARSGRRRPGLAGIGGRFGVMRRRLRAAASISRPRCAPRRSPA